MTHTSPGKHSHREPGATSCRSPEQPPDSVHCQGDLRQHSSLAPSHGWHRAERVILWSRLLPPNSASLEPTDVSLLSADLRAVREQTHGTTDFTYSFSPF